MPNQVIHLTPKDVARFESKFTKADGCWNWIGYCDTYGYGMLCIAKRNQQAHRIAYSLYIGPIPKGVCVLHRCDNAKCVNPQHLWLGTKRDNARDMVAKGRRAPTHGELNGQAKLTETDVMRIRQLAHQPGHGYGSLARRFAVGKTTIAHIVNGDTWVHVTGTTFAMFQS